MVCGFEASDRVKYTEWASDEDEMQRDGSDYWLFVLSDTCSRN